jgi:hypothetical protein
MPRLSGRTEWGFDARHRQLDVRAGALRLDVANDISLQTGVILGLIPSVLVPRQDLSTRGALFLTLPGGEQRLLGVWKLRLSALGGTAHESADTRTDVLGASFGMGPCLAPTYDTRGWVVLLCTEYGGGGLTLDSHQRRGARVEPRTVGFGTVGLGLEAEYNFASIFQVGARLGWDVYLGEIEARRDDGSRIFEASANTLHVGVGLGLRF